MSKLIEEKGNQIAAGIIGFVFIVVLVAIISSNPKESRAVEAFTRFDVMMQQAHPGYNGTYFQPKYVEKVGKNKYRISYTVEFTNRFGGRDYMHLGGTMIYKNGTWETE